MMKTRKLTAMMMAFAMTAVSAGTINIFAAEEDTPETINPTSTVFSTGDMGSEKEFTADVTPELQGAFQEQKLKEEAFVEVTISWDDMNFIYDFGTYTVSVQNKEDPNNPTQVKVDKVNGAGWNDKYKEVKITGVSTIPIDVELSIDKSEEPCYQSVNVYFDNTTGGNNSVGKIKEVFTFKPSVNKRTNFVDRISESTFIHVNGAPDYSHMNVETPPRLFTYKFVIKNHVEADAE